MRLGLLQPAMVGNFQSAKTGELSTGTDRSLAPSTDETCSTEAYTALTKAVNEIVDPADRYREQKRVLDQYASLVKSDFEWSTWYWVLLQRFPEVHTSGPAEHAHTYLLATLYSTGWTLLLLLSLSPRGHWLLWVGASLSIIAGMVGDLREAYESFSFRDPFSSRLIARMLFHLEQQGKLSPRSDEHKN